MHKNPFLAQTGSGVQLASFILLWLVGALFGSLLGILLVMVFFGIGMSEMGLLMGAGTAQGLEAMRMLQVASHVGIFLMPPLLFALLISAKPLSYLGFKADIRIRELWPYFALMFACLPFIYALSEWNRAIALPDALSWLEQWMQAKEVQAKSMQELFLGVTSIGGLVFNLFMIALLPSLGEELVFRGVLQPLMGRFFRNAHLGIIVSSLLFGMMHLQFFSLLPMFVLGLFLGYAYYLTKNIWVPIMMHFVNNAAAIIVYYLWHNGHISIDMDGFGSGGGWPAIVLSLLAVALLWMVSLRNASTGQNV